MANAKLKARVKVNGKKASKAAPSKTTAKPVPDFVYFIHIASTPEKVWQALTDNAFITQYFFGHTIQSEWKPGASLQFFRPDGAAADHGKITVYNPPRALAYSFEMPGDKTKRSKPTEVKFEILPMLGGVKLILTHTNLTQLDTEKNPFTLRGLNNGWPAILSNLKSVLESGKACLDMAQMDMTGNITLPKRGGGSMNLTTQPQDVKWPETHYVFFEKVGPFMETAKQAWDALHEVVPALMKENKVTQFMALYKFKPDTYRAGLALAAKPKKLPAGMGYEKFKGGSYAKWVLTGPYADLPEACGYVFDMFLPVHQIKMRNGWCIENYTNDPEKTPEKDLVTEIHIPV